MTTQTTISDNMALTFADKAKVLGATSFFPCKWESFRVDGCKILFEPNVYNGTGEENRVNVCIQNEQLIEKVLAYEEELTGPVSSAVKGEMDHVKCKITWDKIRFYDLQAELTDRPQRLGGWTSNIVFVIKGKWVSHGQSGLSIEATDIQLVEAKQTAHKNPFL